MEAAANAAVSAAEEEEPVDEEEEEAHDRRQRAKPLPHDEGRVRFVFVVDDDKKEKEASPAARNKKKKKLRHNPRRRPRRRHLMLRRRLVVSLLDFFVGFGVTAAGGVTVTTAAGHLGFVVAPGGGGGGGYGGLGTTATKTTTTTTTTQTGNHPSDRPWRRGAPSPFPSLHVLPSATTTSSSSSSRGTRRCATGTRDDDDDDDKADPAAAGSYDNVDRGDGRIIGYDRGDDAPEAAAAVLLSSLRSVSGGGGGARPWNGRSTTTTRIGWPGSGNIGDDDPRQFGDEGQRRRREVALRAWLVLEGQNRRTGGGPGGLRGDDPSRGGATATDSSSSASSSSSSSSAAAAAPLPAPWGLESLGTRRWNDCVQACLLFDLYGEDDTSSSSSSSSPSSPTLLGALCGRLQEGDALSRLTAADMSHTLLRWSLSSSSRSLLDVANNRGNLTYDPHGPPLSALVRAYCRRIRKRSVLNKAPRRDLMRALRAARLAWHYPTTRAEKGRNDIGRDPSVLGRALADEVATMAYTVARAVVLRSEPPPPPPPPPALSTQELATLWSIVGMLKVSSDDPLLVGLVARHSEQCQPPIDVTTRTAAGAPGTPTDGRDSGFDDGEATAATFSSLADISSGLIRTRGTNHAESARIARDLGERFRRLVELSVTRSVVASSPDATTVAPRRATDIVRSAALLHPKNPNVVQPFVEAYRHLLVAHNGSSSLPSHFLNRATLWDVSNIAWFLSRVQCSDRDMIEALAQAVLCKAPAEVDRCGSSGDDEDYDDDDDQSVKQACRILVSFTDLFGLLQCSDHQRESSVSSPSTESFPASPLLSDLFGRFGPSILLSPRELSPRELSLLVNAYAKSSHVQDMGIFDHLVQIAGSRTVDLSNRQLAQCLWACGRVASREESEVEEDLGVGSLGVVTAPPPPSPPPYLEAALAMTDALAARADELTAHDVTQALWALGHLLIAGPPSRVTMASLQKLSQRAKALDDVLSPREVSNMLWALGRLSSRAVASPNFDVVYALTRRFVVVSPTADGVASAKGFSNLPSAVKAMNPQECALVLQAMAWLDVRDAALFGHLSDRLVQCVNQASAQSIAMALWSHRAVHLSPPAALLDRWASTRLGLSPVAPDSASSSSSSSYESYF